MHRVRSISLGLTGVLFIVTSALGLAGREQVKTTVAAATGPAPGVIDKVAAMDAFRATNPGTDFTFETGPNGIRIERVYGPAFSHGATALQSAEQFRTQHADMFGVAPADLLPAGTFDTVASPIPPHEQPIMYIPETGEYKFTGVYYQQGRDGLPVFRSRLMLLARNEANFPVVLASADLRDIGNFRVPANFRANDGKAMATITKMAVPNAEIIGPELIIWAGYDNVPAVGGPTLAQQYIVDGPNPTGEGPWRWLFLVDATTGALLYSEDQVCQVDISGTVKGNATSDYAAWNCPSPEVATNIPFARVTNGINTTYCDINGNYVLPNAGSTAVNVTASLVSQAFAQHHQTSGGATTSLVQSVTPPGPGNFLFNPGITENPTAEVNSFIAANLIRNMALTYNPSYPTVATQTNFPVNTNISQNCNAYYTASTINFYIAGGGCANTGYSSVAYHEYGHNLIEKAGSGQGAYGEGQSDVMSIIMQDTPCLGDGFQACGTCLRSGVNACNYSSTGCSTCGSAIHTCGQVISGCVWNTRNNLQATNPLTYRVILSNLAVNSMLLHSGTAITPSITIDYLTLDDNDADINNGTPHYTEINNGFTAKNMPGPPLSGILFNYPNGKPAYINPAGGTTMRVNVTTGSATPQPGTGKLYVSTGGAYTQYNMTEISANVYDAVFPAVPCGTPVRFYVSAQTTGGTTVNSPTNAPTSFYAATGGTGAGPVVFDDNFQTNLGWTVTNSVGLTTGAWERGTPVASSAAPSTDADGSGMCYVTGLPSGNFDIDGGSTTLTSPILDASQASTVSYYRWYNNNTGAAPQADTMVVEISSNGGAAWSVLETVGPTTTSPNPEVVGGWFQKTYSLSAVPGFALTNQFRIRFTASDLGSGSYVEAGVDGVKLQRINCANPCPADTNGDNQVNVNDLLAVINAWGACPGCPSDVNDDGEVNVNDLLIVINAWGSCP